MASSRRKGVDAQGSIDALPPYVHNGATNPNSTPKSQNAQVSISHQNLVKPALSSSSPPPVISFSIDVKDLLHAKDGSKRKPALYIAFAASHPVQANAVKRWLGDHVSVRHVYTDAEKAGWAEWCEEIDTKSGSIFFHDERPLYCDLKYFSRCLASAAGIACYNMSFERRHPGAYRCAISRLFPRGTAIFITERSILRYPEEALHMMRWFEKSSTGKVESWRMCLMPNAVEWILKRIQGCDSKNEERFVFPCLRLGFAITEHSYLGMIDVIHRLQMQLYNWNVRRRDGDPEQFVTQVPRYEQQGFILPLPNLPGYSSWADIEDSDLTEDMVKARDIILLEYFCAWAATKAGQYRKFLVLDDIRTNKTQNHSWHIKFWDPIQFKREIRY
ncbi:hypothetical protein A1O3_08326 [Capronia epimyces CBS 606.96]|uniref:Uncharacterized protein n=1 Tax=Capronia epimyces CBS 606.96 TaxID=1182542 RepID=W9XRT1_9EURO|nr:uncharacterized protein A1O3_08326 [Capronia epimyces CBS 606.96]EXJ80040.1 hypothetical protein A1O3_08326 [Capronia epimyces CBS 606.96]